MQSNFLKQLDLPERLALSFIKRSIPNTMKAFFCFIACIAVVTAVRAQTAYPWATSIGGSAADKSYDITTDNDCNVYVSGYFDSDTLVIGNDTLFNSGEADAFLVKYDATGNVAWAKSFNGDDNDFGRSVSTDDDGNVYLAGYTLSSILTTETGTFNNAGVTDAFYVKFDAAGNEIWSRGFGSTEAENVYGMTSDDNGNVWMTGYFSSVNLLFGASSMINSGSTNSAEFYIVKYDSLGNEAWGFSAGGASNEYGQALATDNNGNVYATGSFRSDSITFGSFTLVNNSAGANPDFFVVKYDASGNAVWATSVGNTWEEIAYGIDVDDDGNVFVAGTFTSDDIVIGSTTLTNTSSDNTAEGFLIKYNPNGNALWAKSIQGEEHETANSVSADDAGNVFVSGYMGSDVTTIGSTSLNNTSSGFNDAFIAKFDAAGNFQWAANAGTGNSDQSDANSVCDGFAYLTGAYYNAPLTLGSNTLPNAGGTDAFVTKLDVTTGVDNVLNSSHISIFPNPSDGTFTVTNPSKHNAARVWVCNLLGEVVSANTALVTPTELNLTMLAKGMYIVHVRADKMHYASKIVIE